MKKFFLFMIFAGLGLITIAQSTRIYDSNITIRKTTPTFSFLPSGGIINFNAGDVTLTHSANTLSLAGGILALPTSGLSLNGTTITTVGGNLVTLTDPSAITFIRINANNTISALSAANFKTALSFTSTDLDDIFLFNSTTDTLATRSYSRSFGGGGGGGSMVYPGAGIALSTGAAWGSSITNNSTNWNTAYTDRLKWDGGATDLVAGTGRTSLGGTTVGQAFFTLSNPGAITFARIDAANTVTARSAANFKADLSLENVTNESKATMFTNGIMTGSFTFPSPFTLGATSVTTTGTELNLLSGINVGVTTTELGYVNGLTSEAQGQISSKLPIANPTATGILTTPALRVGSGGNTVSLDSITSVSSDYKVYHLTDTLNPYIPVADRTELFTAMDTVNKIATKHDLTLANSYDSTYIHYRVDSLLAVVVDLKDQISAILDVLSNFDLEPPVFLSAELGTFADDTLLVLMDTTDIRQDSIPSIAAFNLTEDDITFGLDTILIGHDSIFIALDSVGAYGTTYLLDYTSSLAHLYGNHRLQDSTGNKTKNWVNKTITNNISAPPPPSYPSALDDTHTVLWVCSDSTDYIVKDGSNLVADWQDILLSGHDLEQATASRKPLWTADGVVFDASTTTDHMKTAIFTLAQPTTVWLVLRYDTWTVGKYLMDGFNGDDGTIYSSTSTPNVKFTAGNPSDVFPISLSTFHVLEIIFNGASSKAALDDGTPLTGSWGTAAMSGLTIGNASGLYAASAVTFAEIIIRNVSESAGDEDDIYAYLKDKYGL